MLAILKAKAKGSDKRLTLEYKVFAVHGYFTTEFQLYILSQLSYNFTHLMTAGMDNADAKIYPHCRP